MSHSPVGNFPEKARTLVELARARATRDADRVLYTFLPDGGGLERMSFAELDRRACAVAGAIRAHAAPGERALLLFPPGLDYVAAFFGCLYAGVVAVPAYPPSLHRTGRGMGRLLSIAADARPAVAVTSSELLEPVRAALGASQAFDGVRWLAADGTVLPSPEEWREVPVSPSAVAFLQYTSGSTGTPKGVMVTHANLLSNQAQMREAFRHVEGETVIAGWLPMFHDMGLVGNILHPVYLGAPCVLMSPLAFTRRPLRWLEAISEYRATTSGGPNFAYELCVRKTTPEERATLDLSCWRVAFNGAEPVRAATLERFAEAFKPSGFRHETFYPCYGMAEATLMVTGGIPDAPPVVERFRAAALRTDEAEPAPADDAGGRVLVGSGQPLTGQVVRIVDLETRTPLPEGRVGHVWVSGPNVAAGYWGRPDLTEETFGTRLADGQGPFLRTGDLGFLRGGELFVVGRSKDLMIVRGRNHHPQDVELTAEGSHPAVRPGGAVAFSLEVDGLERVVAVLEVKRRSRGADVEEVASAVRRAVAYEHGLPLYGVVLVGPGSVPRTSSGKLRRSACREGFLQGTLAEVGRSVLGAVEEEADGETPLDRDTLLAAPATDRRALLLAYLRAETACILRVSPSRVEIDGALGALGLDSLSAAEMAARVEGALGVPLLAADLLADATLAGLANRLLSSVEAGSEVRPIARSAEGGEWHPVSPGQRALWFLHELAPGSTAYHIARAVHLRGELDAAAMAAAWRTLASRHGALRTIFSDEAGEVRQRTVANAAPAWEEVSAEEWDEPTLGARLNEAARAPFDLRKGPLLRVALFRRGADDHVLLLVVHHIVADLWSLSVLLRELGSIYAAARSNKDALLPPPLLRHADWARWQIDRLTSPEGRADAAFWEEWLRDVPPLELLGDRPRPAVQHFRGATRPFHLNAELSGRLSALCRVHGATPFMGLLAAFQALLYRYTGQDDFAVGVPSSGRGRPEVHGTVGFFVNPLPLRARIVGGEGFAALLERVRHEALEAFRHAEHPFARTVEALRPERDAARSPLFQAMLVVQGTPAGTPELAGLAVGGADTSLEIDGLEVRPVWVDAGGAQFDLTLQAAPEGDGAWALAWEYTTDIFDAATIDRMSAHLAVLLEAALADPERPVRELPLLAEEERRRVVVEWNGTAVARPAELRLEALVRAQAERTPDAPALSWADGRMDFRQLEEQSERLARQLRGAGVGPESVVAICAERSPEMVVGLLGILKAGAAWLPLDPEYPRERLATMLADSGARVALVQPAVTAAVPSEGIRLLSLELKGPEGHLEDAKMPRSGVGGEDHLAYLIYTSGSTGRPKGAMVPHRGIVNRILWMQEAYGLGTDDVVLQKTPFTFDVSVWEFFWPLVTGARMVLARPGDHRNPERLVEAVVREGVTTLHFVPSMLRAFLEVEGVERCRSVRRVVCSGEVLPPELAERCFARMPWAELHNLYGPTEASVDVTAWACAPGDPQATVPIGHPIANTRVYLLDGALEPVPVAVPGELYIGGIGLARGYVGRPGLTAERFLPDPFGSEPGARVYRTGDLARWSPAGVIEFLGRTDAQIKVRGHRIEPAEVEAALLAHPGVGAAAVGAHGPPAEARLVAWIAGCSSAPVPSVGELRRFLTGRLPEAMIPSRFVPLEALPLTPSGKLDRKALPEPGAAPSEYAERFAPPVTEEEEALSEVWAEVLRLSAVGVTDNFFDLGGDSLLSIEVMSRARARGLHFDLSDLFRHPTVRELARDLRAEQAGTFLADPVPAFGLLSPDDRRRLPADAEDAYPLSAIQHGLVFHAEYNPDYEIYVTTLRLRARWDERAMRSALDHVAERHPLLRIHYDLRNYSTPLQVVRRGARIPLQVFDLRTLAVEAREEAVTSFFATEKKRTMEWERAPLTRMHVHRLEDDLFQLTRSDPLLDGWSCALFLTELVQSYHSFLSGADLPPTEPLAATFRDFVALEQQILASEEARAFWQRDLAGCILSALPRTERELSPRSEARVDRVRTAIPEQVSQGLRALARTAGVPLKSVLLAGHLRVLAHLTGTDDVVSGVIANGRLEQTDGEKVVGSHLNVMPFRLRLRPGSWVDLARETFERERAYLPYRRYPMAELQRRHGRQLFFEAVFNFTHFRPYRALAALPGVELNDGDSSDQTYFPLTVQLNVDHATGGARLAFDFNTGDLSRIQVERFAAAYLRVFTAMAHGAPAAHDALRVASNEEARAVLDAFNGTWRARDDDSGLIARIARRVAEAPDALAVSGESGTLTYSALWSRAGHVARRLRALGVGPERRVALLAPRSPELVVGALAVLRAGGVYVPLDTAHPAERLAFMVRDSAAAVLLVTAETASALPNLEIPLLRVDVAGEENSAPSGEALPCPEPHPESLAYVIYTSGSTGVPKGVGVPHRGLLNLVEWHQRTYAVSAADRTTLVAGPGFDASVWETWPALAAGAALCVPTSEVRLAPEKLRDWLLAERVTVAFLPTPLAEAVLALPWPAQTPLRALLTGGDRLHRHPVQKLPFQLINHYGPTESSVVTAAGDVASGVEEVRSPSIGAPIDNVRAYVLDPWMHPVPPGVAGELCIAGDALAREYVGQPELTARKFVPDPFDSEGGGRLYRTGDRVRWREDGTLDFLGRIDQQVKIRGFRIELGEVEAALVAHPAVREAAVAVDTAAHREERLVAYVVLREGETAANPELHAHLAARLPEYMVPAAFVSLPALPLTPSGKVDRAALPAPSAAADSGRPYIAPGTDTEVRVAQIWAEVLRTDRVGTTDHFFELGGHSLLATQIVSRLRGSLQMEIPLSLVFELPVLGDFATRIDGLRREREEAELLSVLHFVDGLSDEEVRAHLNDRAPADKV